MGSECNSSKIHYDITMSKRTRKPLSLKEVDENAVRTGSPEKEIPLEGIDVGEETSSTRVGEGEENDHKSLKQLINGDGEAKVVAGEENRGRNSLGQHFTEEEKQLQLVIKQQEEGAEGVKFKGMVRRYIKVLSHLIKVKRDPRLGSRQKPALRLTM